MFAAALATAATVRPWDTDDTYILIRNLLGVAVLLGVRAQRRKITVA